MKIDVQKLVNEVYKELQEEASQPKIETIGTYYCIVYPDGYKEAYFLTHGEAQAYLNKIKIKP